MIDSYIPHGFPPGPGSDPGPGDAHGHADCVADLTERLFAEFESVLPLHTIAGVVRACRRDLAGSPVGAMPELTERLARQRLSAAATGTAQSGTATVSAPVSMS